MATITAKKTRCRVRNTSEGKSRRVIVIGRTNQLRKESLPHLGNLPRCEAEGPVRGNEHEAGVR
jgi:hypothetical protein